MQDEKQFCLGMHLHLGRRPLFHSRMQIQERPGFLLDATRKAGTITQPKIDHIWRVPLEFKITEWRPFAALVAEMWVVATETDKGATHTY